MNDPTEGSPPVPVPPADAEPQVTAVPDTAEVAARAAADVTLLLARADGLRRIVELAERSRREADAPYRE
ncbi:hypothetical protein [Pseudonocardia lacus]|uniref:hypothetical protein n=1 Tax=Pseudonocardia lacus TaxID=2835865 RepID=UPI001BDCD047|nr:hypothetical protein [Pseudonocardia lacus]